MIIRFVFRLRVMCFLLLRRRVLRCFLSCFYDCLVCARMMFVCLCVMCRLIICIPLRMLLLLLFFVCVCFVLFCCSCYCVVFVVC